MIAVLVLLCVVFCHQLISLKNFKRQFRFLGKKKGAFVKAELSQDPPLVGAIHQYNSAIIPVPVHFSWLYQVNVTYVLKVYSLDDIIEYLGFEELITNV